MSRGIQILGSIVLAAAAGAGATTYLTERAVPPPSSHGDEGTLVAVEDRRLGADADYAAQIAELAAALQVERDERSTLAAEVASLKGQLARVQAAQPTRLATATSAGHGRAPGQTPGAADGPRPLDVDALVEAGFSAETVREFKSNLDQMELDRLYLRDIATREGWINSTRFREETEALRLDAGSTRAEYGDEFYDWMLYTTGHPNRVEVGSVMSGSAAEDVGLRDGDQVLSYDGERIFSPSELRDATIRGDPGALTPVEVIRNGRFVRLMVPRGPLGIRVDRSTVEPKRAG